MSSLLYALATCVAGIVYAFTFGPLFAGVCMGYIPILYGILGVFGKIMNSTLLSKLNVITHLGGIAEETLTAIKVVASFGREERELSKFAKWSRRSQVVTKKQTFVLSVVYGVMKFSSFTFYLYCLYLGSYFV